MILLLLRFGPVPESTDVVNALAVYGIAAPFAALCLVLAFLFRRERDQAKVDAVTAVAVKDALVASKDARIEELHAQIEVMHEEAAKNAQQLVSGLAPRIYDAALLYREGNRAVAEQQPGVAPVERRLDELAKQLDALVAGMGHDEKPRG